MRLALRTLVTAVVGIVIFGVVIFGTAGTLDYWQGWAYILVFTVSSNVIGVYLALNDPALLARRLKVGPQAETRSVQKALMAFFYASFLALMVVSALDHRFGWSNVPAWAAVLGNVLVALGLMIDLLVFRENSYGASTVGVMEGQSVISTGPYALVRHPMYVGVLVMVVGVPLALGSYWGLVIAAVNVPLLMLRIVDEEAMLGRELEGYAAYARRVRYRLVPGLW